MVVSGAVIDESSVGIRHLSWNPVPETTANCRGIPAIFAISIGNLQAATSTEGRRLGFARVTSVEDLVARIADPPVRRGVRDRVDARRKETASAKAPPGDSAVDLPHRRRVAAPTVVVKPLHGAVGLA